MDQPASHKHLSFAAVAILIAASLTLAGYKPRPWNIRLAESYPSRLTSEGVTVAVEPLFQDGLAARVFDKDDMVTRGIMPVAIVIFNDNDFPVMVDSEAIQLIRGDERIRTLYPNEAVHRLFKKGNKNVWLPQPVPLPRVDKANAEALEDFDHKFLSRKIVAPHDKAGGFLYLHISESKDLRGYLLKSRIYIPEIYRQDTGSKMIFFEVDLQPAVEATPPIK